MRNVELKLKIKDYLRKIWLNLKQLIPTTKKECDIDKTERSVFKIGQSYAVTLPKEFVEAHGLKDGGKLIITYADCAIVEPIQREELLREIQMKKQKLIGKLKGR